MTKSEKEIKARQVKKPVSSVPFYIQNMASAIETEGATLDMRAVTLSSGKGGISWAKSTGSLALDLALGGGYGPSRAYSSFGLEASGKTTMAYEAIADALVEGIPVLFYDAENATDPDYLERIIQKRTGHSMDYYMGVVENGKVIKPGLLYYIQVNTGENVFIHARRVIKSFPRVVQNKKGDWFWAIQKDKNNYEYKPRDLCGRISVFVVIDSLASLITEAESEDDTAHPMAGQARMLSRSFPKITNLLGPWRFDLLYTNQIRLRPGVFMGNPEYETGGEAAKFYSSGRIRYSGVALSTIDKSVFKTSGAKTEEAKGKVDEELSWDGSGMDKFRYVKLQSVKNKSFSPFQVTYARFCFERHGMAGDGLDLSFDAYVYLLKTGQCSRKAGKGIIRLSILGSDHDEPIPEKTLYFLNFGEKTKEREDKKKKPVLVWEKILSWRQFKELVENPERRDVMRHIAKRQMDSGFAWVLYFAAKNAEALSGKSKTEENGDEE